MGVGRALPGLPPRASARAAPSRSRGGRPGCAAGCAGGRSRAWSRRVPACRCRPRAARAAPPVPASRGQEVVELGQLDLEPALAGARPPGEDVEDELGAVEGLAAHRVLEVALLGGRELVVEEHQVGVAAPRRGGATSSTLPRPMRVAGSRRCRSWSSEPTTRAPALWASRPSSSREASALARDRAPPRLTPDERAPVPGTRSRPRQGASVAGGGSSSSARHCTKATGRAAEAQTPRRRAPGRRRAPRRCRCCSS